jgi:hypothetical protein
MNGWGKIKAAAQYAGVSERTFRDWLKTGLKCSRLPTGHLLVKYAWIDEFLEQFSTETNEAERLVNEIAKELKNNCTGTANGQGRGPYPRPAGTSKAGTGGLGKWQVT